MNIPCPCCGGKGVMRRPPDRDLDPDGPDLSLQNAFALISARLQQRRAFVAAFDLDSPSDERHSMVRDADEMQGAFHALVADVLMESPGGTLVELSHLASTAIWSPSEHPAHVSRMFGR